MVVEVLSAEVLQSMQRDSEDRGGRGRRGEEDRKSKRRPVEREVGRLIQYKVRDKPNWLCKVFPAFKSC